MHSCFVHLKHIRAQQYFCQNKMQTCKIEISLFYNKTVSSGQAGSSFPAIAQLNGLQCRTGCKRLTAACKLNPAPPFRAIWWGEQNRLMQGDGSVHLYFVPPTQNGSKGGGSHLHAAVIVPAFAHSLVMPLLPALSRETQIDPEVFCTKVLFYRATTPSRASLVPSICYKEVVIGLGFPYSSLGWGLEIVVLLEVIYAKHHSCKCPAVRKWEIIVREKTSFF